MKSILSAAALAALTVAASDARPDASEALWQQNEASRTEAVATVRKLVGKPLTVSSAVKIALLNNRGLQATFEEIGIARADLLEAVTLPNPTIEFEVQFPVTTGTLNRYAWVVAQEFVQLLMIPLKKRVSEDALAAAQLRVSAQILDVVAQVKKAYFQVQGDQQLVARLKIIHETTATALDLGQKQFKAGNITDLALLQMQASYDDGRLEIAEAETDLEDHREDLTTLLGLWGDQVDWEIEGELPRPEGGDLSMRRLESLAVSQRADLQASQRELTSLVSALGLTKIFRYVPVLDFGFSGERDIDGALNLGPQFRVELPIFNQGQSRVVRGQSELRRAEAKFEELAVEIRSDVRKNRDRLTRLQARADFYHDHVLPDRIRIVNQMIPQYNAMQVSPYELFTAKAQELTAERGYIATLRDYWVTRAALEQAVGGTLTPHSNEVATISKKEKKP
ncbi:MAG TPA: TolC family protein [Chthoniobacterales bacterium]|nr:TolC family protein [Chthoniobacterales bacterium]